MLDERLRLIGETRARNPAAIAAAAAARRRRTFLGPTGRLMIIAADHAARGILARAAIARWRWRAAPTCSTGSGRARPPGSRRHPGNRWRHHRGHLLLLLGALEGRWCSAR